MQRLAEEEHDPKAQRRLSLEAAVMQAISLVPDRAGADHPADFGRMMKFKGPNKVEMGRDEHFAEASKVYRRATHLRVATTDLKCTYDES